MYIWLFKKYKSMALDQVDVDKPPKKRGLSGEMTFLDHLEALRWHLVRSVIAIAVLVVCFFVGKWCVKKGWIEMEDE